MECFQACSCSEGQWVSKGQQGLVTQNQLQD